MDLKTILKKMLYLYFVIYTGSMFATFFFCMAFYPDATFKISYFAWMMLLALLGDLPMLVFYSKKEPSRRSSMIRNMIHFLLLEVVLMTAAYKMELYDGIYEGIWFVVTIFLVYLLVWRIEYLMDMKTAEKLNRSLLERRKRK